MGSKCCKDSEKCGLISRIFLYVCGFIGIVFSLMAVYSCDFLRYSTNSDTVSSTLTDPFDSSEQAKVGLFRWWDVSTPDTACQAYDDTENDNFNRTFRMSQVVSYVAVICAALALLLATVEFVCIRFCCSKFLISFSFVAAMLLQALTFAMYDAYPFCSGGRSCSMGLAAIFSIIAGIFYMISAILVCATPKPVPWIRRIGEDEDETGCLACCKKKQPEEPLTEAENGEATYQSFAEKDYDETNNAAAAVAAGAIAGAGTAAVVAAATNDDDKEEEGTDKDAEDLDKPEETGDETAAAAAAAGSDGDEKDDTPQDTGDDDAFFGDDDAAEAGGDDAKPAETPTEEEQTQSMTRDLSEDEPSQQGEEVPLSSSLQQSIQDGN